MSHCVHEIKLKELEDKITELENKRKDNPLTEIMEGNTISDVGEGLFFAFVVSFVGFFPFYMYGSKFGSEAAIIIFEQTIFFGGIILCGSLLISLAIWNLFNYIRPKYLSKV